MEKIAKRIEELIRAEGLSNSEFAKRADINPAIVSHILSGRNKPSLQVINNIKEVFTNVNLDYLVTGSGPLYNDFTNVNKEHWDSSAPPAPQESTFPTEGLRAAAVPGEERLPNEPVPEETSPAPAEDRASETEPTKSEPGETKQIEQIVIFYTDGSFKAYHPSSFKSM